MAELQRAYIEALAIERRLAWRLPADLRCQLLDQQSALVDSILDGAPIDAEDEVAQLSMLVTIALGEVRPDGPLTTALARV